MIAEALGYVTPVQGALPQEAIDVAVILNAPRALSITPRQRNKTARAAALAASPERSPR
jgi:hypothetical protein